MRDFVPPYPHRPREPLPLFTMIAMARHNFLGVFDEKCFESKFFSTRLLRSNLLELPVFAQLRLAPTS